MKIHIGEKCIVCGKTFTETDDVVVCPECGTPYHRACWQEHNACINQKLHETGESWQPEHAPEEPKPLQVCPDCGTGNPPDATHCRHCGKPFLQPGDRPETPETFREQLRETAAYMSAQNATCGIDPETTLDGERLEDVADFVAQNHLYYLPKFLRFSKGHRISLNFPCLLFPQYYLAYRKMWAAALIIIGILSLLSMLQFPAQLIQQYQMNSELYEESFQYFLQNLQAYGFNSEQIILVQNIQEKLQTNLMAHEILFTNLGLISNCLEFVIDILLGLFGNRLYYRFVLRRVHKTVQEDVSPAMRRIRLRQEGGVSGWNILAVFGIQMGASMILVLVLMLLLAVL